MTVHLRFSHGINQVCPKCHEPLVAFELEGVEIDCCVECRGAWLDAGELELIAEMAGVVSGPLTEALRRARGSVQGKRRCPRCGRKLREIHVGQDEPLVLDRCPGGHGFWLDHGEMEAFVGSFHEGEGGAAARFIADLYGRGTPPDRVG